MSVVAVYKRVGYGAIKVYNVSPTCSLHLTTLQVERRPDAAHEGPAAGIVRVYAIATQKQTGVQESTLMVDPDGWPVMLEIEEQLGIRAYRRIE